MGLVFKNLIRLLGKVGLWDFNTHELISCIVRRREVKKEQTAAGGMGASAGSTFNARTNIDGTELRARSLMERWVEKIKRNKKPWYSPKEDYEAEKKNSRLRKCISVTVPRVTGRCLVLKLNNTTRPNRVGSNRFYRLIFEYSYEIVCRLLKTCFQRKTRLIPCVFRLVQYVMYSNRKPTPNRQKEIIFFRLSKLKHVCEISKTYKTEFCVDIFRTNAFLDGVHPPNEGFLVVIFANTFVRKRENGKPFWDFYRPYILLHAHACMSRASLCSKFKR